MKNLPDYLKKSFGQNLFLLLLLLLLAACGGGAVDEAVEEVTDTGASEVTDTSDSEAIEDGNIGATGSEEDSGELPPTPIPGSKVETSRATAVPPDSALITANPTPANRGESEGTAVSPPLDLVLLIDTTGSMANELSSLQADLPDWITNLTALSAEGTMRLGLVAYGDAGKQDPVQLFALTENRALFAENLATLTAVGGGDYPEDLNAGFYQAVTSLDWRPNALKLLILLGDAPPQSAAASTASFEQTSALAAGQNITLVTIGSDGLDAVGAAIYEQIAQTGNGRFYFISDDPLNRVAGATAVYPTAQLPTALAEIVQEVLNAQLP
ncbi:MAG: VWA domain-containing protein [Anaerolineaceae bacterium]|nr:VWA domain-containing protein [Anaerolineaceae bacterium]